MLTDYDLIKIIKWIYCKDINNFVKLLITKQISNNEFTYFFVTACNCNSVKIMIYLIKNYKIDLSNIYNNYYSYSSQLGTISINNTTYHMTIGIYNKINAVQLFKILL